MSQGISDALVFFGATSDLAHKKIFPALQGLARHGRLDIPVVGVAKSGWTLDQLKARAADSVEKHGRLDPDAFARLTRTLRYIEGDYTDSATFKYLRPVPSILTDDSAAVRTRVRARIRAGLVLSWIFRLR